jgi:hypothetical protein
MNGKSAEGCWCVNKFSPEHDPCKRHEPTTKARTGSQKPSGKINIPRTVSLSLSFNVLVAFVYSEKPALEWK